MAGEVAPLLAGIPIVADATARELRFPASSRVQNQRVQNLATGAIERWDGAVWVPDFPQRFDIRRYGAVAGVSGNATTNTAAIHTAIAAASANGGGIVEIPPYSFNVSELTFGSASNVILQGTAQGYSYGNAKTASNFVVTTGVWGVRFPPTSSYCGLVNIGLQSDGALSSTPPHPVITPGVEYGVLIETGSTTMEGVTSFGFQYGCVIASGGNSNTFDRCSFTFNTKCGFAATIGTAGAYAAYHPNLTAPASPINSTVWTMTNCNFRRNGWGLILRDGGPNFVGTNVCESNWFGGIMTYVGSLDSSASLTGSIYLESNWLLYDATAAYTVTQNNLLKETANTWMLWTSAVATASNDAGYQIYAMSSPGNAGTLTGPGFVSLYNVAIVCGSGGATPGKAIYLKQSYLWKFYNCGCTGGDQPNAVRLGAAGGYNANGTHFYDYGGTLPASLGNRGAEFHTERSNTYGGGLTAGTGYFKGLFGNVQFPATAVPSADANCLDDYAEGTWTPVPTSLTVVGTPTYTGTYTKVGRRVHCVLHVVSTTSTASTANTTFFTGLPFSPSAAVVCMAVSSAVASFGNGLVGTNGRVNTPTWSATADVTVSFSYDV